MHYRYGFGKEKSLRNLIIRHFRRVLEVGKTVTPEMIERIIDLVHPDWARIDEKGNKDNRLTSVFGPYTEKLLIPQLEELSDVYGIDGVWVDGECWVTERDYGEKALRLFREKTDITTVPRSFYDSCYYEFSEFNREGFRKHLDQYVTTLHRHNPGFQVCSNWAYSSHMKE